MFKIIKKERLNPTVTKMVIDAPFIAKKAEPGQFIILRALEDSERIPLTIADYDREGGMITIIYQIVGGSTMELDTLEEGQCLHDFVGPLGVATHTDGLKKVAVVSGGVASLWEKYTSIDDVMAENETLKAENAELRQQMVDYDRVKAENQAYKALESIQSQRPEMSYLSSFVIGRDPLDSFYGFTLDRGTLDGVAVNDAVVSDQGYLLGMVVEAEPTSCKVMTILHPNFNAAGVVSRTRDNGIVTGSSEYAADGLCVLTNLARNTLTEKSDQVVTTGLGGVFPADLLVGVVQELVPEVSGKSTIAVIKPGTDPRTVRHAFIITSF